MNSSEVDFPSPPPFRSLALPPRRLAQMGSPPIPDRSLPPRLPTASTSTSRASSIPPAFRSRSPPRPHPGLQPAVAPASVPFSPPKRNTGGSIKGKEKAFDFGGGADEGVSKGNKGARDFPPLPVATYRHLLGTNNGGAALVPFPSLFLDRKLIFLLLSPPLHLLWHSGLPSRLQ